jgi:hypothetical protein
VWPRDEREQERRVASAGAMADCLGRVDVGMWACEMRHLRAVDGLVRDSGPAAMGDKQRGKQ